MAENKQILKFPDGFLWGSGSSAHQVEGGLNNDWTAWEKNNATKLAHQAPHKWQDWQLKQFPEMLDPANYLSGQATDFYSRYKEDFDLAKELSQNAHRLSIDWARLEPEAGKFDQAELKHYQEVIAALLERGLEPMVTIWHWPLPLWLCRQGGLESPRFPRYLARLTREIVRALPEVKFWITLNEPEIYPFNSYLRGVWPPQKKNPWKYFKVINNLVRAHRLAYMEIKAIRPKAQVGIAAHNVYFEAYKNYPQNLFLKLLINWWWNYHFLDRIRKYQDFIGLNYYFHHLIRNGYQKNENKIVSDLGWELHPWGIYQVLKGLAKYNKPIYITENGLADSGDQHRAWYIKEVLAAIHRAISEGVKVRGYLHWALTDFFEWDKGFWPRFGLIEIDRATLARKIRPSAKVYAEICKNNQLILD